MTDRSRVDGTGRWRARAPRRRQLLYAFTLLFAVFPIQCSDELVSSSLEVWMQMDSFQSGEFAGLTIVTDDGDVVDIDEFEPLSLSWMGASPVDVPNEGRIGVLIRLEHPDDATLLGEGIVEWEGDPGTEWVMSLVRSTDDRHSRCGEFCRWSWEIPLESEIPEERIWVGVARRDGLLDP